MYRPYVSTDIEATGLGEEAEVLQIAAVFDVGLQVPVDELPSFDVIFRYNKFEYSEPYAMVLNQELLKIISKNKDERILWPAQAIQSYCDWLDVCRKYTLNYDAEHNLGMKGKHMIAGKNVAGYDKPRMLTCAEKYGGKNLAQQLQSKWVHRCIDVGPMFFDDFGYIPSLDQINEITGRNEVNHNALDDSKDVVYGVRHKYKRIQQLKESNTNMGWELNPDRMGQ